MRRNYRKIIGCPTFFSLLSFALLLPMGWLHCWPSYICCKKRPIKKETLEKKLFFLLYQVNLASYLLQILFFFCVCLFYFSYFFNAVLFKTFNAVLFKTWRAAVGNFFLLVISGQSGIVAATDFFFFFFVCLKKTLPIGFIQMIFLD